MVADHPTSQFQLNNTFGYFLSGFDYLEVGMFQRTTTWWTNATWPVEIVNTYGDVIETPSTCDAATGTVTVLANETRYQGKWVILAPSPFACSVYSQAKALRAVGANGIMRARSPGQSLGYIPTPLLDYPLFLITNDMFISIRNAVAAPVPSPDIVPVPSPSSVTMCGPALAVFWLGLGLWVGLV